jgi:hypothetical protein
MTSPSERTDLTVAQILAWADAHHAAHGAWPAVGPGSVCGEVPGAPHATWKAINHALAMGLRGLPGDSSLAELLAEHRGAPPPDMGPKALADKIWAWEQEQFLVKGPKIRLPARPRRAPLTLDQILAWADNFHGIHGRWPEYQDRSREAAPGQTWYAIDQALRRGRRGLPGGSSLGRLLVEHRGPEARPRPARLTLQQILAWADAHHAATGEWPKATSGAIAAAPADTWGKIELALRQQGRGLKGKTSLARLLAEHRGKRHPDDVPRLTLDQILAWADLHHAATGEWPTPFSGPVAAAPGETWSRIQGALYQGSRGLPGGTTLPQVLAGRKPPPNPTLTVAQIRTWAEGYHQANGRWPDSGSGPVAGAPGETWHNINKCLRLGRRGLPGGMRLEHVLGRPTRRCRLPRRSPLTIAQILGWADRHHAATGKWPSLYSGAIPEAPGERWADLDGSLRQGRRGLGQPTSLSRMLAEHRGVPDPAAVSDLSPDRVFAWADAHYAAHGSWPTRLSGPIATDPEHTWRTVDRALVEGYRGLPGGTTLRRLLAGRKPPPYRPTSSAATTQ